MNAQPAIDLDLGIERSLTEDDLRQRIAAIGEGDIPTQWTPEHVGARLIEGFRIIQREGRVGPRTNANGWPEYLKEFSDLTDLIEDEQLAERRKRPSAEEVSRMSEALRWPMDHLDGKSLAADAVMFWAYASATNRDMAAMLHQRKKRATAMAGRAMMLANAPAHYNPETGELMDTRSADVLARNALRFQIAQQVTKDCNSLLARSPQALHGEIKLQAIATLRGRCRSEGCLPIVVKPIEAMPGKVMTRTTLDKYRKIGMELIAKRLRRHGIPVR